MGPQELFHSTKRCCVSLYQWFWRKMHRSKHLILIHMSFNSACPPSTVCLCLPFFSNKASQLFSILYLFFPVASIFSMPCQPPSLSILTLANFPTLPSSHIGINMIPLIPPPSYTNCEATMVDQTLTVQAANDSQILHLNNWNATLHFDDVEGLIEFWGFALILLLQDMQSDNSMFVYFCLKSVTPKIQNWPRCLCMGNIGFGTNKM